MSILLLPWQRLRLPRMFQISLRLRNIRPRSHRYAKLKFTKAALRAIEFRNPGLFELRQQSIFKGLHPLPDSMKIFYNIGLSTEGNFSTVCTMTWLPFTKLH